MSVRCGIGYDLHRLEAGRKLIVGGLSCRSTRAGGTFGWRMCWRMRLRRAAGAAGLGDIGTHFPDTDPKWKGANSLIFWSMQRSYLLKGFCDRPRRCRGDHRKTEVGSAFPKMRTRWRVRWECRRKKSSQAKTNEGVDAIGRGEAIAAHVVATISGDR